MTTAPFNDTTTFKAKPNAVPQPTNIARGIDTRPRAVRHPQNDMQPTDELFEADTGDTGNGSPEIPASFFPTTGAQAKVDAKLRQLGIVVDWSTYVPSRNRSWASQGMPSGTAEAYTVSEAEEAGSYTMYNRRTVCFYVPVSKLARTPVERYDVNDRMGSDYREIGVDTKFVPAGELHRVTSLAIIAKEDEYDDSAIQ